MYKYHHELVTAYQHLQHNQNVIGGLFHHRKFLAFAYLLGQLLL